MRRIAFSLAIAAACVAISRFAAADDFGPYGTGVSYSSSGVAYGTAYGETYGTLAYRTGASESLLFGNARDMSPPIYRPPLPEVVVVPAPRSAAVREMPVYVAPTVDVTPTDIPPGCAVPRREWAPWPCPRGFVWR